MSKKTSLLAILLAILAGECLAEPNRNIREQAVEEIVIRASRQNTSLTELPGSVTVLDRELIKKARITNLRQLDEIAPNVSINQTGQVGATNISIRGVQSNPFVVNRVAVYVDGIPFRDPRTVRLNNIAQIEILRGPQSTLYGANANAGIIVIESEAPGQAANEVTLGFNHFEGRNTRELSGNFSRRLRPGLGGGLNFRLEDGASHVRNTASSIGRPGAIRDLSMTGRLAYAPGENTAINLLGIYNKLDAPGLYELEFPALDRALYDRSYGLSANNGRQVGRFELVNDAPKDTREREWALGLAVEHSFSWAVLNAVVSHRRKDDQSAGVDLDLTARPFSAGANELDDRFTNLELRFSSPPAASLRWLIGANYFNQERARRLLSLAGPGGLKDFIAAPEQRFEAEDISVFGQLSYPLSERLELTAGLRYEHSLRVAEQDRGVLDLGRLGRFGFPAVDEDTKDNTVLPRLSLSYHFDNGLQLYSTVAKGHLPGGYNLVAAGKGTDIAERFGRYGKEEIWSYEIGGKGYLFDRRLFFSTAIFYINASSWQQNRVLTDAAGRVLSTNLITSAAAMDSRGLELELSAALSERLSLRAGFGYTDARYKDYPYTRARNFAGNKVYLIPEFDLNLSAEYALGEAWYLRANLQGTGPTPLNPEGSAVRGTLFTGGLTLAYEKENWSLALFVDNISNQRYAAGQAYRNFLFGNDGNFYASLAPPRVIGLSASLRF